MRVASRPCLWLYYSLELEGETNDPRQPLKER